MTTTELKSYITQRLSNLPKINPQTLIDVLYELINTVNGLSPWTDDGTGNVYNIGDAIGIGTNNPSSTFHVVGSERVQFSDTDSVLYNRHDNLINITSMMIPPGPGFSTEAYVDATKYYYELFANTDSTDYGGTGSFVPLRQIMLSSDVNGGTIDSYEMIHLSDRQVLKHYSTSNTILSQLSLGGTNNVFSYEDGIVSDILTFNTLGINQSVSDVATLAHGTITHAYDFYGLEVDNNADSTVVNTSADFFEIWTNDNIGVDGKFGYVGLSKNTIYIETGDLAATSAKLQVQNTLGLTSVGMTVYEPITVSDAGFTITIDQTAPLNKIKLNLNGVVAYASLAAASADGLGSGDIFRIGTALQIVP